MGFEILSFIQNAIQKVLSLGLLPENAPEINMEGFTYNPIEKTFYITLSSHKSSITISKVKSIDYKPSRRSIKINRKIFQDDSIDIEIPYSMPLETINSMHIKLYFQDVQNRRYVAKISISPRYNSWQILQVRRAFCK